MSRRRFFQAFTALVVTVCLLAICGVLSAQGNSDNAFERVKEVQERNTAKLMAKAGVIGTAIGLNEKGSHTILILLDRAGIGGLPNDLEGVPVQHLVTGKIEALPGGKSGSSKLSPAAKWPIPVPIGVSTGNIGECSSGTISCRVTDGSGNYYALSNNHVYALENNAPIGSNVLQPGLYDTGCKTGLSNLIGTLSQFVPIDFRGGNNTVDCAIAATTVGKLGNATPSNGYGTPKTTTATAYIGMPVQKYGRTTGLTSGKVYALHATLTITYSNGTATFTDQIVITPGTFIKAGDSGSLMVTKDRNASLNAKPVGLLFAGSSVIAIANPIDPVLSKLGVTIDGN
jgi:hypothetical protein